LEERASSAPTLFELSSNEAIRFVSWQDILTSDEALQNACTGQDVVFHAAARFAYERSRSTEIFDTAVRGTENVLRTCAQVGAGRVVVTSSSVVFGYSSVPAEIDESKEIVFTSEPPYVAAKIEQHRRSLSLAAELNLNVVLACPTMTLGPTRGDLGPSNGMILAYLADHFRCTYRGGCNLVSGRDIAEGHILLGQHGVSGQAYLLGGENLHWEAIHTAIADLAGVQTTAFQIKSHACLSSGNRRRGESELRRTHPVIDP